MSTQNEPKDDIHITFDRPEARPQGGQDQDDIEVIQSRPRSMHSRSVAEADAESLSVSKQTFRGGMLFWLAYQSVGVIYGDIGTSPLYVYSSTFLAPPSYDDLLGALSLIIWTLTLVVSIKYCMIVLSADDEGEGGTFALYSLLTRYCNIINRDPKDSQTIKMERYRTEDLGTSGRSFRNFLEKRSWAQHALKVLAVLGVCLIMADGILTPAQSVLGAIQGLKVVKPDISTSVVIGVSCAILILLFLIQSFGTSKIATCMAPVVVIWLLFNMAFGIYNLVKFDHSVLKAFSPYFAGRYLVRNKEDGWRSLGGILLAYTGVEALYADLGAFSATAIRISWLGFGYPCLLLAYIGQAAYISQNPEAYSNPFFNSVPPGMFWPGMVISILAAIVASQAMITATFQLLSQVMHLSYFPRIKVVHTSTKFYGQIYIPAANYILMVGSVIVTAVYNNTTKLGQAYGTCVALVTLITTLMVAVCAIIVWRLHLVVVIFGFLVFGALDGLYLSSAVTKVPDGAWFTFLLAAVLSIFLIVWRYGKESQWTAERGDKVAVSDLVRVESTGKDDEQSLVLTDLFGGAHLTDLPGVGIFFDKSSSSRMAPLVFMQFVNKFHAHQEIMIFFHLSPLTLPAVPDEDKYLISRASLPGCYAVAVRYGYSEHVTTADLDRKIYYRLRDWITKSPLANIPGEDNALTQIRRQAELNRLDQAFADQIVFVFGKEQLQLVKTPPKGCAPYIGLLRRISLNAFVWIRELTRDKVAEIGVPIDRLVEIGFVKLL